MKPFKKVMIVFALCAAGALFNYDKVEAQATVSFQVFYDGLSPYGNWVPDPEYGYVWMPAAVAGFSPYSTGGHWVLTNVGWAWVSDYPWGWAPFHYGRWRYNDFYGWQWIPGNEWAPAWVSWRRARGYYGWAPLGPGVSVSVAIGSHYSIPHNHWVFVNEQHIGNPHVSHYYAPHNNNVTIIKNSTVINNTYIDNSHHTTYIAGPHKDEVQKITGKPVKAVAIRENNKPGQSVNDKELTIYRPAVKNNDNKGDKPAPKKVTDLKEIKTINGKQPPVKQDGKNNTPAKTDKPGKQPANATKPAHDVKDNNPKKGNDAQNNKQHNADKTPPENDKQHPNNTDNKKPNEQQHPDNNKKSDPPK